MTSDRLTTGDGYDLVHVLETVDAAGLTSKRVWIHQANNGVFRLAIALPEGQVTKGPQVPALGVALLCDRQPDGIYSAYPGPDFNAIHFYTYKDDSVPYAGGTLFNSRKNTVLYVTADATYELVKQGSRELFKFKNDAYKFSERFYKIAAEFFYNPVNNTVLFIPNNKSIPSITLELEGPPHS
ncbi:hypothetical protein FOL46_000679 [Perkinsus olseni]|uniref:Uncharacterized protein n=1 Tax=Perkinsus olseni TaxID=32597 RepID=A0A7J6MGJ6_PEROL|nr:hypothetical protein FOL46_000679 [Perkinsus olseni]